MLHVGHVAPQRIRLEIPAKGESPLVGASLRDRIHHAAGGAAELGAVAAGLDLELIVELERNAAGAETVAEVRDVHAVDVINVFRDRGAAQRCVCGAGAVMGAIPGRSEGRIALHRARRHQHHRILVPGYRQALNVIRSHDPRRFRARYVKRGDRLAEHDDFLHCPGIFQQQFHGGAFAHVHLRGNDVGLQASQRRGNRVAPHRERRKPVAAIRAGYGGAGPGGVGMPGGYGSVRYRPRA